MSFFSKLTAAIRANDTLLCVGLDPQQDLLPDGENIEECLLDWGKRIIEQTSDLVCCYKPNFAFYEQFGLAGLRALQRTLAAIPDMIPVILDVKRGDIGSTASALATAAYEQWGADAVTLSPYLGEDSIKPFLASDGKAVFILCYTSNPSAAQVQQHGVPPLFEHIARTAQNWGNPEQIGLVVGATQPDALLAVREICPQTWILAPGVGAQGANLGVALRAGLRADSSGLIIPVSRGVIAAADPRQAAMDLRDNIRREQAKVRSESSEVYSRKTDLIADLFKADCIKFGNFVLASGKQSPIYIDLRRVISFPGLFRKVTQAYAEIVHGLKFDHIASVPYAALPAGSVVAWQLGVSMIYPRKEVKQHGTGQAIEGSFEAGQSAVMIEDVITTGGSIVTAADVLRQAGIVVKDVVVLVDREQGGCSKMEEIGLNLHSVLKFSEIVSVLKQKALVDAETYKIVMQYINDNAAN
ncbi:MAG: orotidine-5'-phosphate decarboxylase [Pelolinea sp.]|nr:orotidine-5'-phosphate decarboxylase [Pelolinea sp.]